MRQAPPCQVSVTRSFFELLSRVAPERAGQLKYQGLLSDTVGRPLGWYALDPAHDLVPGKAAAQVHPAPPSGIPAAEADLRARGLSWRVRVPLRWALMPAVALAVALAWRPVQAPAPQLRADTSDSPALEAPRPVAVERITSVPAQAGTMEVADRAMKTAAPATTVSTTARRSPPVRKEPVEKTGGGQLQTPARGQRDAALPAEMPPARHVERPASAPEAAAAKVVVRLAVRPWGEVLVNGHKAGVTPPMKTLQLVPGTYAITVINGKLPPFRRELTLHAGSAPVTLIHDFQCTASRDIRCPEAMNTPLLSSTVFHPKTTIDRTASGMVAAGRAGRPDLAGATAAEPAMHSDAVAAR
jgi:hypothetical protein